MIQLTYYGGINESIDTAHGNISYLDWLINEKKRILKNPYRRVEIRTTHNPVLGHRYALFVNCVAGRHNVGTDIA